MYIALVIIAVVVIFDVLLVWACIRMSGKCFRAEEKIVHCEDCEYWDPRHCTEGHGWCGKDIGYRPKEWYCAAGKRRTTDDKN